MLDTTLMSPASSAVIAFVTTIHLALVLLRQHRSARGGRQCASGEPVTEAKEGATGGDALHKAAAREAGGPAGNDN